MIRSREFAPSLVAIADNTNSGQQNRERSQYVHLSPHREHGFGHGFATFKRPVIRHMTT